MRDLIKRWISEVFVESLSERVAEKVVVEWRTKAMREMAWEVFSTLGIEELERVVKESKEQKKKVGHSNYEKIGEIYAERLKEMSSTRIKKLQEILKTL